MIFCNYLGIIFTFLEFTSFYKFSKNVYFLPPILMFSFYILLIYMVPKTPRKKNVSELTPNSEKITMDISSTPKPEKTE